MRLLIRLAMLALAGYGAWRLYEQYGPRAKELRGPAQEFSDRTTTAVQDAVQNVSRAAGQAASSVRDAEAEVERAARDAADEAERRLSS